MTAMMMMSRREILRAAALGGVSLGVAACGGRSARGPAAPAPRDVDGLVELLETERRAVVLDRVVAEIRRGLAPESLTAALMIAGSRTVLTRKMFSKEQHALVSPYAIHHATGRMARARRWQPLLWAVDYLKWAQEQAAQYDPGPMPALSDAQLPASAGAAAELERALEAYDGERAEVALVALLRGGHRARAVELLLRYGSRDFRDIGHKVIHVANALRTLDVIGWDRSPGAAEVVLRPVVRTLALRSDEPDRDLEGAWSRNRRAGAALRPDWERGAPSDEAITALLTVFRAGDQQAAEAAAIEWLERGTAPRSVWEATLLSSAELLLTHPGAVEALHAVTASNAAHATYLATRVDADRRLLLLQNVSRVAEFHTYAAYWATRRKHSVVLELTLDELEPEPGAGGATALDDIARERQSSRHVGPSIARKTLAYLSAGHAAPGDASVALTRRALELAVDASDDTHDFKLPVVALEDAARLSPPWRARYLAAITPAFRGATEPRTELADRIAALTRDLG